MPSATPQKMLKKANEHQTSSGAPVEKKAKQKNSLCSFAIKGAGPTLRF
jgi:hypothetical protein